MSSRQVKLRLRIMVDEAIAVGPGKIALLEALAECGSITAAAKQLGMSYRRAWLLIDDLNRALKSPAVATAAGGSGGGGSELTDTGRELVALYRRSEAVALQAAQAEIKQMLKLLAA
ncbi:MAG TPA: LysR family transcriptional regulator [Burkholderiaceae bacterium]